MKSAESLIQEWNAMPTDYMERLYKLNDLVEILNQLLEYDSDLSNRFFCDKFKEWDKNPSYLFKLVEKIISRKDVRHYEILVYFFNKTEVYKWWGYSDDQRIEDGNTQTREEFYRFQKLFEAQKTEFEQGWKKHKIWEQKRNEWENTIVLTIPSAVTFHKHSDLYIPNRLLEKWVTLSKSPSLTKKMAGLLKRVHIVRIEDTEFQFGDDNTAKLYKEKIEALIKNFAPFDKFEVG